MRWTTFGAEEARAATLPKKKRSEIAKAARQTTMPTAVTHAMVVASGGIKRRRGMKVWGSAALLVALSVVCLCQPREMMS